VAKLKAKGFGGPCGLLTLRGACLSGEGSLFTYWVWALASDG